MTKRRRSWIIAGVLLSLAYVVLTGGLTFSKSKSFGGQRDLRLVDNLNADIWLAPNFSDWSIPFIYHHHAAKAPFGLRLQVWDSSKSYTAIEITEILIQYSDGEEFQVADGWRWNFEDYTRHNSSSSGIVKTEIRRASNTVPNVVARHVDVTVSLTGSVVSDTGERIKFVATEEFTAKDHSEIMTYWEALNRI